MSWKRECDVCGKYRLDGHEYETVSIDDHGIIYHFCRKCIIERCDDVCAKIYDRMKAIVEEHNERDEAWDKVGDS